MLMYEDKNGNLYFYVSADTPFSYSPMNLQPCLSKKITIHDVEWLLDKYEFVKTELEYYSLKVESKPTATAYVHKSLDNDVRVVITNNSPDQDKIIAKALEQISRITFKYNQMYTPVNVIQLIQMCLERVNDTNGQEDNRDFELYR